MIEREGELREVHTNRMEGFWAAAKSKLKQMRGTSALLLFSYLAEIIWKRNAVCDGNMIDVFFHNVHQYYPLDREFHPSPEPLFGMEDIHDALVE